MPVIIDGTLGVNAAAITTTNWTPTNITTGGNTTLGDASGDTVTINASTVSIPNSLNFDSNTLFIDSTNDKVYIGSASSNTNGKLQVNGSIGLAPNSQIRQWTNGDSGSLQFFGTQLVIGSNNSHSYGYTGGGLVASVSPSAGAVLLDAGAYVAGHRLKVANASDGIAGYLDYSSAGTSRFYVDSTSGNVGISNSNPSYRLDVFSTGFPAARITSSYSSASKTYSTLILGTTSANAGAQFGYVVDQTTAANSFAHITPFGTAEGLTLLVRGGKVAINAPTTDLAATGSTGTNFGAQFNLMVSGTGTPFGVRYSSVHPDNILHVVEGSQYSTTGMVGVSLRAPYANASGISYGYMTDLLKWDGRTLGLALDRDSVDSRMGNVAVGSMSNAGVNGKLQVYESNIGRVFISDSTLGTSYGGAVRGYGVTGQGGWVDIGTVDANVYNCAMMIANQATAIIFRTNGGANGTTTERVRIDGSGNLGVGTASPSSKLTVAGGAYATTYSNALYNEYYYSEPFTPSSNAQTQTWTFTCGSYNQHEVIFVANQTNGGPANNYYVRGIWHNNYDSHVWNVLDSSGGLTGATFTFTVSDASGGTSGQDGRLRIVMNYGGGWGSVNAPRILIRSLYGGFSYSFTSA